MNLSRRMSRPCRLPVVKSTRTRPPGIPLQPARRLRWSGDIILARVTVAAFYTASFSTVIEADVICEFSRPVRLERIGRATLEQSITATVEECRAVSERLQIPGVARLSARVMLEPAKEGVIAVTGTLKATVTQVCVASGDPFPSDLTSQIHARFTTDPSLITEFDPEAVDPDDEWDDIELVEDGAIDIGELAVQYLSLALDPYPHKPDAEWRDPQPDVKPVSPFAVLAGLKKD